MRILLAVTMLGPPLAAAAAGVDEALPRYEARLVVFPRDARYVTRDGAIMVVGYNDMKEMLAALGARFTALHPRCRFVFELPGTKAAPSALAAGISAFAPMGAVMTPAQLAAFEKIAGAPPLVFRVAHASLDPKALSGPLAIFVHRGNPLSTLTFDRLAAIFSGADTLSDLRPCGVVGDSALGQFFRGRVLGDRAFAKEFVGFAQSADVVKRVGEDPRAIGFAAAMRVTPEVKMLALAEHAGDVPVVATNENIMAGRYPLDRHLLICARAPLEPWIGEFLSFVLSRDGQELIAAGTLGYLPLNAQESAIERSRIP